MADVEFERSFVRPALLAGIGVVAVLVAIALNFFASRDADETRASGDRPATSQSSTADLSNLPTAAPASSPVPAFDVVRINPRGDTVIAGRAEPGSTVQVSDGQSTLGEVIADGRGEWVFVPETPLPSGSHRLSLQAVTVDGRQSQSSDQVIIIVPVPGATQSADAAHLSALPLALRVPNDGGPATILQKPSAASGDGALGLDAAEYGPHGTLLFSGRAPADARIRLSVDGKLIGEAAADATGEWRLSAQRSLQPEAHAVIVEQLDARGRIVTSLAAPLNLQETRPTSDGQIVVQQGQNLWRIARAAYGRGTSYTIVFEANRGRITDPDLIYPGQVFRMPSAETSAARQ